jgi:hypothetical protein
MASPAIAATLGRGVGEPLAAGFCPSDLGVAASQGWVDRGSVLNPFGSAAAQLPHVFLPAIRGDEARHEPPPDSGWVLAAAIPPSAQGGDAAFADVAAAGRITLGAVPPTFEGLRAEAVGLPFWLLLVLPPPLLPHLSPATMPLMLPSAPAASTCVLIASAAAWPLLILGVGSTVAALTSSKSSRFGHSAAATVGPPSLWPLLGPALSLVSAIDTMARTL